mmetsp:Transcript_10179/g.24088  ORF Transcript_10179/g.24088 Transcript_10179/m.24088 type:complete len:423 (+) Transcript_10179:1-1269(+)
MESIEGPFQLNPGEEVPLVCFQFKMSHFGCKAYFAAGTEEGTRHLKLQTIFEDSRNSLIEEQRYFLANEWNTTKPYTRLKCGFSDRGHTNVFTLEYDMLCPITLPHSAGVHMLVLTLRTWYTSMVSCVMHIVSARDLPFATHSMIVENTLTVSVREEDLLRSEACPICLETFQVGDKVRRLPCMHCFHMVGGEPSSSQGRHCNIDKHLVVNKQCPVCKTPIDIMERLENDRNSTVVSSESTMAITSGTAEPPAQPQATEARPAPAAAPTALEAAETSESSPRLPEQAAELERVVRSLQSRWLQIQDVVAGVQQMLHYIEDSHTALSSRTGDATAPVAPQPADPVAPAPLEVPEVEPEVREVQQVPSPEPVQERRTEPAPQVAEVANWQPFAQAEKVCHAYTWRRRRLSMLQAAQASADTPER